MTETTYKVPAFTVQELICLRVALRDDVCRFYKWRHDTSWRQTLRATIAAYRKLQQAEVAL